MQTVAFGEDAEVVKTGDVVVMLKFSVVRDLQNAGAFLAERRLFPSFLHRRRPFSTQVNHRYAHTVNTLPERSMRDFPSRSSVDRMLMTDSEALERHAKRRQASVVLAGDRNI